MFSRNVHIIGMGESTVDAVLPKEILESSNPTVAPYCATGEVRLRVTARAATEGEAAALCDGMLARLKETPVWPYVYGVDVPSPEAALLRDLAAQGMTIAVAESCTGGLIAKRLTDMAGCSSVVAGGVVTYQTREKTAVLGVPAALIAREGVVSEAVAREMAERVRLLMDSDIAIATTGYAGPGGGTQDAPVGTVFVAVSAPFGTVCKRYALSSKRDRAYVRELAATYAFCDALSFLRSHLTENDKKS